MGTVLMRKLADKAAATVGGGATNQVAAWFPKVSRLFLPGN